MMLVVPNQSIMYHKYSACCFESLANQNGRIDVDCSIARSVRSTHKNVKKSLKVPLLFFSVSCYHVIKF